MKKNLDVNKEDSLTLTISRKFLSVGGFSYRRVEEAKLDHHAVEKNFLAVKS